MDLIPYHIGIATNDIETSRRDITAALGLTWSKPASQRTLMYDVQGHPQIQPLSCSSQQGPIHIDLIEGEPGTLWKVAGPQIHHVAYRTDDLPGDIAALEKLGWRMEITVPNGAGHPSVFAYLVRDDGARVELVEDDTYRTYMGSFDQPRS